MSLSTAYWHRRAVTAGGAVQVAGSVARLNQTVRRMLLEKLVPTLASLKATLEEAHSPLQQPATDTLVHLWREHEAETEDILVSQRQLSAEIRFKAQVPHRFS